MKFVVQVALGMVVAWFGIQLLARVALTVIRAF